MAESKNREMGWVTGLLVALGAISGGLLGFVLKSHDDQNRINTLDQKVVQLQRVVLVQEQQLTRPSVWHGRAIEYDKMSAHFCGDKVRVLEVYPRGEWPGPDATFHAVVEELGVSGRSWEAVYVAGRTRMEKNQIITLRGEFKDLKGVECS